MTRSEPSPSADTVAAIVVAGGAGSRYGGAKQYEVLRGRRVLDWSLAAARASCGMVVLVVPAAAAERDEPDADVVVVGGDTRSASVRAGLAAVSESATVVVIHDAARPLARPQLFDAVIETVRQGADAAVPGIAVADTLRLRTGGVLGVGRDELVAVQTPQAFDAAVLRRAHAGEADATDDASLVDAVGGEVVIIPGDPTNRKITEPVDLQIADVLALTTERL